MIGATKREKLLCLTAAIVLGVYLLDTFVFKPLGNAQAELRRQQESLESEYLAGLATLRLQRALWSRWKSWIKSTLLSDPSQAESQLLNAVRSWARESGVEITFLQPERPNQKGEVREIAFRASTTGPYVGLMKLLYRFQCAKEPVRIQSLDIRATRRGPSERIVMDLRFSTIYRASSLSGEQAKIPQRERL